MTGVRHKQKSQLRQAAQKRASFCIFMLEIYSNRQMALEMKLVCEKCGRQLPNDGEACICTYECTFCAECAEAMNSVCPNCGGELVRRPRAGKVNRAGI